jgi:apolipoprotein N-acyltransferase
MFGMAPLSVGEGDKTFHINDVRLAPSVCFESMVPHRIASQVRTLTAKGDSPDILVNITNDGWFRGSSMLDHHLACSTLAAIENRRPMVIAANTGISAWIDGSGQVQARGARMSPDQLLAEPYRDSRWGLFQVVGDWPIRMIALVTWLIYVGGLVQQKYFRKDSIAKSSDSTQPA